MRRAVNYGNAYEWVNRYLDETQHGLVFGYGELFVSNGAPVFTIKATNTTAVAANTTAIGVPFAPGGLTSENIGAATTKIDPYVLGSLT